MRNKIGNAIWGILFVIVGLIIGLKALGFIDNISFYFNGWWTLFIIIPCVISIVENGFRTSNVIGLLIGVLLLTSTYNILPWDIFGKLIIPIIFVAIGVNIIFKDNFNRNSKIIKDLNKNGQIEYSVVFSGQEINIPNQVFEGANINSIFGGISLNLKNAIIDKDIVIDATAIFGGVDIVVPSNVNVKVSCTPIFGGVSNKVTAVTGENVHTVYLNAVCMFGGVEVK